MTLLHLLTVLVLFVYCYPNPYELTINYLFHSPWSLVSNLPVFFSQSKDFIIPSFICLSEVWRLTEQLGGSLAVCQSTHQKSQNIFQVQALLYFSFVLSVLMGEQERDKVLQSDLNSSDTKKGLSLSGPSYSQLVMSRFST